MSRPLAIVLLLCALTLALACAAEDQVARIMHGRQGTAVLIDVTSGKVLGAYHPEVAARRLAMPGSAAKPFSLLVLLESEKLKPEEQFICRRNVRVGKRNLACSHPQTGQPFDAISALAYSCNDYFATMALRLTGEELRQGFVHSGFTAKTGLMSDEASGSAQLTETREQRQLQAVGEFGVKVTPLELLNAYRMLAARLGSHPDAAAMVVREGLKASTDYGMARLGQPQGLRVAGKTGTSRAEEGSWTHGWFAGFAPADDPKVTVVVFLEHGTGPADAAPLAAQILQAWMSEPK